MDVMHVIVWFYSDKSDFGVVRVYDNENQAISDLNMLKSLASDKQFTLLKSEYID